MSSRRIAQVNKLLHHEIGTWFSRSFDPPKGCVVTIEEVLTSADLGHAKVLLSIFPDDRGDTILHILEKEQYSLRGYLMGRLTMKHVPILHFKRDDREVKAEHIHRLLDKA